MNRRFEAGLRELDPFVIAFEKRRTHVPVAHRLMWLTGIMAALLLLFLVIRH
jgi:hypothetical protein